MQHSVYEYIYIYIYVYIYICGYIYTYMWIYIYMASKAEQSVADFISRATYADIC
jgi:hypothetical protein